VGKTSIFKAIQFCLYGSKATGQKIFHHINRTVCAQGDGTTLVKLSFDHDEKSFEIIRSVDFEKTSSGSFPETGSEKVDVIRNGKPVQLETTREQNEYIEAILPEDASQFFLFDGEEIQKYTQHPPGENVKEAIEMVLGIRELLFARDDLDAITRDLKRELDALLVERSKQDKEALEVEAIGKDISKLREQIDEYEERIRQAEDNVRSCDETLRKNKAIQEKIEERKRTEQERDSLEELVKANEDRLREFNQHLGVILAAPLLQELSKAARKTIPHWKRNAIAVLIQSDRCICERPIDSSIKERFERQLEQDSGASTRQYMGDQATDLLLSAQPSALEKDLYDLLTQRSGLFSNLGLAEQKIEELSKEIGQREDLSDDIKGAADTRDRAAKDLERYKDELKTKRAELDVRSSEYRRRQQKLADLFTDEDIASKKAHLRSAELCELGINEAIDNLVEKSKSRVTELASEVFLKLTNAPALYQGIEITEEYELKIRTIGGVTRPVWDQMPSAGQSQIIATSFIAALNRYSAREAPIIIDTPVGRLDPVHKNNLIRFYPEMGPQVVILYQPNELGAEDIAPIGKYISSEWLFERDPHNPDATLIRRMTRR
jgi:DNA sulfur modification protein DndD